MRCFPVEPQVKSGTVDQAFETDAKDLDSSTTIRALSPIMASKKTSLPRKIQDLGWSGLSTFLHLVEALNEKKKKCYIKTFTQHLLIRIN
jgi:hypothetical protein